MCVAYFIFNTECCQVYFAVNDYSPNGCSELKKLDSKVKQTYVCLKRVDLSAARPEFFQSIFRISSVFHFLSIFVALPSY